MIPPEWFPPIAVVLVISAQIWRVYRPMPDREFVSFLWFVFLGSVVGIFLVLLRSGWTLYVSWYEGELTRFLLPPYENLSYFLSYVFSRTVAPWTIAFAAALCFGVIAYLLNKRMGERFFRAGEPELLAIGVFLSGYPGLLLYVPLMLICGCVLAISGRRLGIGRVPLYFLWMPVSLFVILVTSLEAVRQLIVHFNL